MSTTAGSLSRPTAGGLVSVPAMLKPLAGIVTSESVGLRAVNGRTATPARSLRTIARFADGSRPVPAGRVRRHHGHRNGVPAVRHHHLVLARLDDAARRLMSSSPIALTVARTSPLGGM